jgi:membrane-bound metal-dependent hydrolase YbcI (DUF457 family)
MALSLAHGAAGYLVYEAFRPTDRHRPGLLLAAVTLANAPDFDFLPGLLLGRPEAYHRGVTHTVLAVVVVGLVVALAVRWFGRSGRRALRVGAWSAAAYGSHLLLDLCTADAVAPHGTRFLWPFSDAHYLAPVTPLAEILIDPTDVSHFFASLVTPAALAVWAGELGLVLALVGAVHLMRALSQRAVESSAASEPE